MSKEESRWDAEELADHITTDRLAADRFIEREDKRHANRLVAEVNCIPVHCECCGAFIKWWRSSKEYDGRSFCKNRACQDARKRDIRPKSKVESRALLTRLACYADDFVATGGELKPVTKLRATARSRRYYVLPLIFGEVDWRPALLPAPPMSRKDRNRALFRSAVRIVDDADWATRTGKKRASMPTHLAVGGSLVRPKTQTVRESLRGALDSFAMFVIDKPDYVGECFEHMLKVADHLKKSGGDKLIDQMKEASEIERAHIAATYVIDKADTNKPKRLRKSGGVWLQQGVPDEPPIDGPFLPPPRISAEMIDEARVVETTLRAFSGRKDFNVLRLNALGFSDRKIGRYFNSDRSTISRRRKYGYSHSAYTLQGWGVVDTLKPPTRRAKRATNYDGRRVNNEKRQKVII
jgi:hypothetical protein